MNHPPDRGSPLWLAETERILAAGEAEPGAA